jgi:hypothetical protein
VALQQLEVLFRTAIFKPANEVITQTKQGGYSRSFHRFIP